VTFEKATIIGTSPESFTAAADDAVESARQKYEDLMWAEVSLRGVELANVEEAEYQVEAVVAYED